MVSAPERIAVVWTYVAIGLEAGSCACFPRNLWHLPRARASPETSGTFRAAPSAQRTFRAAPFIGAVPDLPRGEGDGRGHVAWFAPRCTFILR